MLVVILYDVVRLEEFVEVGENHLNQKDSKFRKKEGDLSEAERNIVRQKTNSLFRNPSTTNATNKCHFLLFLF